MAVTSAPPISGYRGWTLLSRTPARSTWRATRDSDGRDVAVKVHEVALHEDRSRFRSEVEALGVLRTRHLAPMLAAGLLAGARPWFARPYYEAMSFNDRLEARGPLSPKAVIAAGLAGSSALCALHDRGLVHGNVKPENLFLDERSMVVLADPVPSTLRCRAVGPMSGQLEHQSPEVLEGQEWSAAGDVYALGSTLYTLVTGQSPYEDDAEQGATPLLRRILDGPVPVPQPGGLPSALARGLLASLSPRVEDRPTAASLAGQLRIAAQQAGVALPAPQTPVVRPSSAELTAAEVQGGTAWRRSRQSRRGEVGRWAGLDLRPLRYRQLIGATAAVAALGASSLVALVLQYRQVESPPTSNRATTSTRAPATTVPPRYAFFVTTGARVVADGVVELSFRAARDTPGFQRYVILKDAVPTPDQVPPDATTFQVANLNPSTQHCFAVVAVLASEPPSKRPPTGSVCIKAKK